MAPAGPENDAAGTSRSLTWRLRRIALVAFDAGCWVFALFAATLLRYERDLHQVEPGNVALIAGFAVVGVLVIGTALQVYRGRRCIGTVGDAVRVSAATALLGAGLFVPNLLRDTPLVPRTVPLVATLIALVLAVGARLLVRLRRERSSPPDRHTSRRVIIYGAGTDGQQLVRSMLSSPGSGYLPVALLDDRPDPRRRRVSGVDVRGTHADLAAVVAATRADLLVMAERGVLDRDESALHATQPSIHGTALLDSPDVILADIRDAETVNAIFKERRPDVVFHAAALKHLPLLEQYPEEAWKTNVIGTRTVLEAARLAQVDRFVNISTDKAANPVSVLGRSKRIGERLVAHVAAEADTGTFLSVRFGNVLGSRGSVITTFAEQLAAGLPITVTHPDVTRFFMTIPEAVQLVVHAAAIGRPGEALVLDMGAPVRIADVARQLMEIAGQTAEIVYTGLREGEKLHEELFGDHEVDRRPIHPLISHVEVPDLDPANALACAECLGVEEALVLLTGSGRPDLNVKNVDGKNWWFQPA
jgi:FlaA1/EpsC-like NDP-sugar epimerase